uniref:Uncharacterized protein n=1 Tax=Aegilops tauschii subsp. strangulata TaxID=200361 RepID=A0A452YS92_AEGTS
PGALPRAALPPDLKVTSFHLDLEGMGTRAATSAPVAAVSSVLFGRSLPQTPLPTRAHCWGFPPWTRRTTSAAWRSSSGCFLERSREMGSSPTAGAAVLPDGLLPAVLGCISWWWQGFIERSLCLERAFSIILLVHLSLVRHKPISLYL